MDDEIQVNRLIYAIVKAFNGDGKKQPNKMVDDDDEEIIDTTQPEFAEKFKGFTNTPVINRQQSFAQRGTEIIRG